MTAAAETPPAAPRGNVKKLAGAFLVLVAASGLSCGTTAITTSTTPPAVVQTLAALQKAGLPCSDPTPDNVPSGLLQWRCSGPLGGVPVTAFVDADSKGLFEVTAQVPTAAERGSALKALAGVVSAISPLQPVAPDVVSWIDGWKGRNEVRDFGQAMVGLQADASFLTLTIFPGPRRSVNDP